MKIRKAAIVKKENGLVMHISFDPSKKKQTVEAIVNIVADAFDDEGHHEHTTTLIYLNYSQGKKH